MKTNKRFLVIMLSVASIALVTAFVTLAYLIDEETVVNTFTVGDVDLSLDETDIDGDNSTKENKYHLIPGNEYVKDPTVTVSPASELSYVRMIMTVHNADAVQAIIDNEKNNLTDYADLLGGWDEESWIYKDYTYDKEANTIAFEFRYKEMVDGYDENGEALAEKLPPLFERLIVPGTLNSEEMKSLYGDENDLDDDFKIVVVAQAIQATTFTEDLENGLTAEDVAWTAFDEQVQL